MSAPIRVIATFAIRPEYVDDFIAVARATLVDPARREDGCVQYDLCQDVADPTRFAMIEAWESETALEAHLARESLRAAVARLAPMAAEQPKVTRLRPIDDW